MTPEYILRKSLCRPAFCGHHLPKDATDEQKQKARESDIRSAISCIENMTFSHAYAESGYSDPKKCILFSNWNYFCREVTDLLESYGYDIEWEDEWTTCSSCNKALRTTHDSYGWQPSYVIFQDEYLCLECLDGEAEDYLESLENHPSKALNHPGINPAEHGYVQIQEGFESGWHPGQNDDPKKIYAELHKKYPRLLFQVDSVGQFDIQFSVWSKKEEKEEEDDTESS